MNKLLCKYDLAEVTEESLSANLIRTVGKAIIVENTFLRFPPNIYHICHEIQVIIGKLQKLKKILPNNLFAQVNETVSKTICLTNLELYDFKVAERQLKPVVD